MNPSLVWRPDDRTRVGLGFEYVRSDWPPGRGPPLRGRVGIATLAPVSRETSYQSPFDVSEQDATRFRFDAERKLGGGFTLRNRFYFTRARTGTPTGRS